MPTRRLTVSVPQPCHEDWNTMTLQNQGRFCQSCSKMVVDFTKMSDAEVVSWLSKQKGNTCGRFTQKQTDRELVAVSSSGNQWKWKAVALGFATWASAKTVEAQQPTPKQNHSSIENTETSATSSASVSVSLTPIADDSIIIKGVVVDFATKDKIPGVAIFLKGKQLATYTDGDGYFTVTLPDTIITNAEVITFHFIGYKIQEKKVSELLKKDYQIISLETDSHFIGEVVIVKCEKWYSPRGLFYKARNLFR